MDPNITSPTPGNPGVHYNGSMAKGKSKELVSKDKANDAASQIIKAKDPSLSQHSSQINNAVIIKKDTTHDFPHSQQIQNKQVESIETSKLAAERERAYIVTFLSQFNPPNVNGIDKDGFTPLTMAVAEGNLEMVKLLVDEFGAEINGVDGGGLTPLTAAIVEGNFRMVKLLVDEYGAEINGVDGNGFTPLTIAVAENNFVMIKLLVDELGADINGFDGNGFNPLSIAVAAGKQDAVEFLKDLGAEENLESLERKFLANVWGIRGFSEFRLGKTDKTVKVEYEGLTNYYSTKMLRKYVSAFFDDAKSSYIPKEIKSLIMNAIDQGFPLSENSAAKMAADVRNGEPLLIANGKKDHAISFVLCKGQLAICNRGEGRKENAVEFFSLSSDKVTEEIINKFLTTYSDIESFNQMIESLNLISIGGYHQKDQKIENCAWASPKAAVGALLCLYLGRETGGQLYKEFTGFTRERCLSDYYKKSASRDAKLLQEIEEKKKASARQ